MLNILQEEIAKVIYAGTVGTDGSVSWEQTYEKTRDFFRELARKVLLVADSSSKTALIKSGFAGAMPGNAMIVDRRIEPTALPVHKNQLLSVPEPKQTDLDKVKNIVKEFINKQGHEKCWYYPDLFKSLVEVLGVKIQITELPDREAFEAGCREYQDSIFGEK